MRTISPVLSVISAENNMLVDHIAVLVSDLEQTVSSLPNRCTVHPAEFHPGEGTSERYITFGDPGTPSLLLMEAVSPGPYSRALSRRGPGLHHLGCVCSNTRKTIANTKGNLLLHPASLETVKSGVIWLCRPGLPFLIELMERELPGSTVSSCIRVELPSGNDLPEYASSLFPNLELSEGDTENLRIRTDGLQFPLFPGLST